MVQITKLSFSKFGLICYSLTRYAIWRNAFSKSKHLWKCTLIRILNCGSIQLLINFIFMILMQRYFCLFVYHLQIFWENCWELQLSRLRGNGTILTDLVSLYTSVEYYLQPILLSNFATNKVGLTFYYII